MSDDKSTHIRRRRKRKPRINAPSGFKGCPRCEQIKPLTSEFFKPRVDRCDGFESWCRECCRKNALAALRKKGVQPAKRNLPVNGNIQCIGCQKWYPATSDYFYVSSGKWLNARCKDCFRIQTLEWRRRNRDKVREIHIRRRALENNAEGSHTADDIVAQRKRQKQRCYYCGKRLIKNNYHVDHVVPLSRGGSNGPENIVIACPHCNDVKNDKLPHEWPEGGRLL